MDHRGKCLEVRRDSRIILLVLDDTLSLDTSVGPSSDPSDLRCSRHSAGLTKGADAFSMY